MKMFILCFFANLDRTKKGLLNILSLDEKKGLKEWLLDPL